MEKRKALEILSNFLSSNIVHFLEPHSTEGPIKSPLSVCLCTCQFGIFVRNG